MKNLIYITSFLLVLSVMTACSKGKKAWSCECEVSGKSETVNAEDPVKAEELCKAKEGTIKKCSKNK